MPRDLQFQKKKDESELTASPDSHTGDTKATDGDGYNEFTIHQEDDGPRFGAFRRMPAEGKNLTDIHPYVQSLNITDVDSCSSLEKATFPEHERCSKEKFIYRLSSCPELSLGLFSTSESDGPAAKTATYAHARSPDSANPAKRAALVAQVISTKCTTPTVSDESMEVPTNWRSGVSPSETRGHQEQGRTVVVHSLAALPDFKGRGLGQIVMKSYMQRIESSGIADRIALLAHDPLVRYYEALGFRDLGQSEVKFGGGGWHDMVYDISNRGPGS
ncbi:MAG: hypothetical protein Q9174_002024 [Haloplaca sp. 1 TL-2023]